MLTFSVVSDSGGRVKPDWQSDCGRIQLYCGDCLDILPTLSGVDAVITDPPYGVIGKPSSIAAGRAAGQKNNYGSFSDSVEYVRAIAVPAIELSLKIAKRAVVTPGNRCLTFYPPPQSFGCFYQPASVGLQAWGRADSQPILYYGKHPIGGTALAGSKCSHQVTEGPSCTEHPCAKPMTAWTKLVICGSLEGETVCDPFMGSGTTGIACIRTGRKFIGIEKDPKHFATAKDRIERELSQQLLPLPL